MKSSLLAFVFLTLMSCAYSYTKINPSIKNQLSSEYFSNSITFSAPSGYIQSDGLYLSDTTRGLISLDYDILSGPNIYGSPFGETRIYLYARETSFEDINEYHLRREELSCEMYAKEQYFKDCVDLRNSLTIYEGEIKTGWHLYIYQEKSKSIITYDFVTDLGNGNFIEFTGVISDRAYDRKRVREQRIQLINDIFNTVEVKPEG